MYACKESFGIKVNIVNIQLFDRKESSKWLPHIYYVSTLFFSSSFTFLLSSLNTIRFLFFSISCTLSFAMCGTSEKKNGKQYARFVIAQ